jgi:hypothetical protein
MNMGATESGRMQRCAIASVTITLIAVLTAAADIQRHLRMEVKGTARSQPHDHRRSYHEDIRWSVKEHRQVPRTGSDHPHRRTPRGVREVWRLLFGAVGRDLAAMGLLTCTRYESRICPSL